MIEMLTQFSLLLALALTNLVWRSVVDPDGDANDFFITPPQAGSDQLPPENPVYRVSQILEIQWATNHSEYTISLYQQNRSSPLSTLRPPDKPVLSLCHILRRDLCSWC